MNNSIVTQDITDVLDKLQHRISEHSWTLSCKNRIFKLEIKWQDSRAILTNVNTKPPTPHHSAKPTYFDAEPIGLNVGRVDPPTSRLPTIKIKRKSPSKIRRDKARLELWKSRRKTGQTTSNDSSTTSENQQSTGSHSSSTITVPPAVHKSAIKRNTVYCNYSSDSEYESDSDSESVSDSSHTISQPQALNTTLSPAVPVITCATNFDECLTSRVHPHSCDHNFPVSSAVPVSVAKSITPLLAPSDPIPTFSDWKEMKLQPPPSLLPTLKFDAISPPVRKRHTGFQPKSPTISPPSVRKRHSTEIKYSGEGACQRYCDKWSAIIKGATKPVKPDVKRPFRF